MVAAAWSQVPFSHGWVDGVLLGGIDNTRQVAAVCGAQSCPCSINRIRGHNAWCAKYEWVSFDCTTQRQRALVCCVRGAAIHHNLRVTVLLLLLRLALSIRHRVFQVSHLPIQALDHY